MNTPKEKFDKSQLSDPELELYNIAKINDILDIFLFIVGFAVPFTGDLVESIIGGIFDVMLLVWMFQDKDIGINAIWIFFLETLDLTDFLTMGVFDVIGWVEMVPFWVIGFRVLKLPEVKALKQELTAKAKKALKLEPLEKPEEMSESKKESREEKYCPFCNAETSPEMKICEMCGAELKKSDSKD